MAIESEPAVSDSTLSTHQDTETNTNTDNSIIASTPSTTRNQSHSESENEQQTIITPSEDNRKPSSNNYDYINNSNQVETPSSALSITTRTSSVIQHTNNNDIRRSPFENSNTSNKNTTMPSDQQRQEDTFYQSLQIRLHHSVGSMSISPTCRDIVLAG